MIHLSIKCPLTLILWSQTSWPLSLASLPINSMLDWILMIINPEPILGLNASEKHPLQIFVMVMLDSICRQRNKIVHNQTDPCPFLKDYKSPVGKVFTKLISKHGRKY